MSQLVELLEKLKPDFHIVFIYIREAHADDVWPLGFEINSAKNLEEKQNNCDGLMNKWPELFGLVDNVFLDNMDNDFMFLAGAWPEAYYFVDKDYKIQWKCTVEDLHITSLQGAHDYASSLKLHEN
jgi:hypothetical protein